MSIVGLKEDTISLIKRLKGAGYTIVTLSDTNEMHTDYIRKTFPVLGEIIDHSFTSYKMGKVKGDGPSIFEDVCRQLSMGRNQVVVLDDKETVAQIARGLGLTAVTFRTAKQAAPTMLRPLLRCKWSRASCWTRSGFCLARPGAPANMASRISSSASRSSWARMASRKSSN